MAEEDGHKVECASFISLITVSLYFMSLIRYTSTETFQTLQLFCIVLWWRLNRRPLSERDLLYASIFSQQRCKDIETGQQLRIIFLV